MRISIKNLNLFKMHRFNYIFVGLIIISYAVKF